MSFPAYPSYKASDIDWLGDIPSHWKAVSLKRTVDPTRSITYGIVQAGPHQEEGVRYIRPTDMSDENGVLDLTSLLRASPEIAESYGRSALRSGDIVCSIGPSFGKVMIVPPELDGANLTQGTARIAAKQAFSPRFLFWCLRSKPSFEQWESSVGGATFRALNLEPLAKTFIALPPPDEQGAISIFLDRETAKIDALVEEQRRLVALLKEKRQAVISHAITKGLNPDAPMKESGIEWLGKVPAHWGATRLKRHWLTVDCKHITADFVDDGIPLASIREVQSRFVDLSIAKATTDEYYEQLIQGGRKPEPGDLIFSRNATVGEVAQVADWHPAFAMGQDVCILKRQGQGIITDFLQYCLKSPVVVEQISRLMIGSTFKRINVEEIRNLVVPVPPEKEQSDICAFISNFANDVERLSVAAEAGIALMQERRAALISAAVTGKIDVRGSAQVLAFPINRARARGLIATEVIERSARQANFGRVKLQKIAYLAEAHVGVTELEGTYLREAAGPLDREMVREMEREAGRVAGIRADQPEGPGTAVTYLLGDRSGTHRTKLAELLGVDRSAKLDKLIDDIATIDTKGAEAVATLYAVWNDALIDGETPTDTENVLAVLTEWHPEKKEKFRMDELHTWLGWMRRHGLVPRGAAPKTSTGRLFA